MLHALSGSTNRYKGVAIACLQDEFILLTTAYRFLRLPEGLHNHEPFAQLVRRARSRVQAEFDDLDAVWASDSLRDDFLKMPLSALLVGISLALTTGCIRVSIVQSAAL